eukprot:359425-Chlamydomonas_euryale.AAC.3
MGKKGKKNRIEEQQGQKKGRKKLDGQEEGGGEGWEGLHEQPQTLTSEPELFKHLSPLHPLTSIPAAHLHKLAVVDRRAEQLRAQQPARPARHGRRAKAADAAADDGANVDEGSLLAGEEPGRDCERRAKRLAEEGADCEQALPGREGRGRWFEGRRAAVGLKKGSGEAEGGVDSQQKQDG